MVRANGDIIDYELHSPYASVQTTDRDKCGSERVRLGAPRVSHQELRPLDVDFLCRRQACPGTQRAVHLGGRLGRLCELLNRGHANA